MSNQWIASAGGPLLCAGAAVAKAWRGVRGSSGAGERTDYERACETQRCLDVIDCGGAPVLVLGDEPLQATFVAAGDALIVARWHSCESSLVAESALADIPSELPQIEPALPFEFGDSDLVLFDSAFSFEDAEEHPCAPLRPGRFVVTTERYKQARYFHFWIHRFIRV